MKRLTKRKKHKVRHLRRGELEMKRDSDRLRETLAMAWALCSSDSQRVVIRLDEKE